MRASKNTQIFLTVAVLIIFVTYFLLNTSKFRPLLNINVFLLALIALGNVVSIGINGLFTKFILVPFGKRIPILESYYVSLISSVGNFFAPVGAGFGFRAIYLKRKFGLPYSEYISTLSGNYILVFLVNSVFGLLSLYLLRGKSTNSAYDVLVAVFALIFIISATLSIFKFPVKEVEHIHNSYLRRAMRILFRVLYGWNHIVSHRKLVIQLLGLTFAGLVLTATMTWMIIHSIHLNVSFAPLILFSVLSSLSLFINLTPANLGVKEAIYLFSSSVLGYTISQIVLIALVDRAVLFLVLMAMWGLSSKMRSKEKIDFKTNPTG